VRESGLASSAPETIRQIQAATRPAVSLDTARLGKSCFTLPQIASDRRMDHSDDLDTAEAERTAASVP